MAFAALRRPMLMEVAVPFLLSSIVLLGMANCKTAPSAKDGQAAVPSPSWSNAAYARQRSDEAWHFAYAVQSWAAQHNAHLIMVPAHSNIVVAKSFFAEEFSQVPISSFPDGRGSNPDQVTVLKHRWTGHGSSWDYDTDIKFVMYGPGYVKEGLRLDKTTLQNLAPTYAQLIGTDAPRGSAGRVMTEALAGKGNRPKVILTIVMDGGGLTLYRAWPNAWPVIKGLASRGVEYLDAKITQLETATGPSHAVIGTGGYPFTTRIVGNDVYDPAKKQMVSFFPEFSPDDLRAPTLADEYGLKTGHRAVVIGASFSAMPAGLRMKLATSITALSSGGARAATFTAMGPEKDSATRANGSLVGSRRSTIATSALASVTASAG